MVRSRCLSRFRSSGRVSRRRPGLPPRWKDDITCPQCDLTYCPKCAADPHPGKTCEENKKDMFQAIWGALGEEHIFMQNESKQCPFCLVWIEKNGGCQQMTCHHCRGEFCWKCFGNWRGHSTCDK